MFSCGAFAAGDGVSLTSEELLRLGPLPVTNSMVTSWIVSLFIIFLVKLMVGTPQLIPTKGQLIVESAISSLRSIIEPIVGKKVFFPSFWLLSGLFLFILIHNWSGLLPGVGTIGHGYYLDGHFSILKPLIRPGNADLNMTLALALVANLCWVYFIVKYAGIKAIAKDLFGNKADRAQVNFAVFALMSDTMVNTKLPWDSNNTSVITTEEEEEFVEDGPPPPVVKEPLVEHAEEEELPVLCPPPPEEIERGTHGGGSPPPPPVVSLRETTKQP